MFPKLEKTFTTIYTTLSKINKLGKAIIYGYLCLAFYKIWQKKSFDGKNGCRN